MERDPGAITAACLVEIDKALTDQRCASMRAQPRFKFAQRKAVGELRKAGEHIGCGEETVKGTPDARVTVQKRLDLIPVPEPPLLDPRDPCVLRLPFPLRRLADVARIIGQFGDIRLDALVE